MFAPVRLSWRSAALAIGIMVAILCGIGSASAIDFRWTGGGGDGRWNNAGNWDQATYPNGAADKVYFSSDCANAPQVIDMETDITIDRLVMDATSARDYTVSSAAGKELTLGSPGILVIDMRFGTATSLVFNVDLHIPAWASYIVNDVSGAWVTFNGNIRLDHYKSRLSCRGVIMNGAFTLGQMGSTVNGGAVKNPTIINNVWGMSAPPGANSFGWAQYAGASFFFQTGALAGYFEPTANGDYYFGVYGEGDQWFAMFRDNNLPAAGNSRFVFVEPLGGADPGLLTLELRTVNSAFHVPVDFGTVTNSVVEFRPHYYPNIYNDATMGTISDARHHSCTVTGPGRMTVTKDCVLHVQTANTHTMGTDIYGTGGLILEANAVTGGRGEMPDVGMVGVHATAYFDINGYNETIGGLGGAGRVDLGGGTLTVAEGVAPGDSVGSLTVAESGSLVLSGGTNVFELADGVSFDQIVCTGGANVTLGGVLKVETPGDFSAWGTYTIIDLNTGTVDGAFTGYVPPVLDPPEEAEITAWIDGNDVKLDIQKASAGTLILVR